MKARLFALALLVPAPALAQTPGWLTDARTGCRMWSSNIEGLDGMTWRGGCVGGLASGTGAFTFTKDGKELWRGTGTMAKGRREGHVEFFGPDGEFTKGEYRNGKLHGHAIEQFGDGMAFEGEYRDGHMNGRGSLTWKDGSRYVGDLKDDQQEGQGTFTFPNGASYTGAWKASMPDGKGAYRGPAAGQGPRDAWSGQWRDGCFLDGKDPGIFRTREECAARK